MPDAISDFVDLIRVAVIIEGGFSISDDGGPSRNEISLVFSTVSAVRIDVGTHGAD